MVMTFIFSKVFFVFLLKFPASLNFSNVIVSLIIVSSLPYHLTKYLKSYSEHFMLLCAIHCGSTMKISSCRNLGRLTINRNNSWSAVDRSCERLLHSFRSTELSLKGGVMEAVLSE